MSVLLLTLMKPEDVGQDGWYLAWMENQSHFPQVLERDLTEWYQYHPTTSIPWPVEEASIVGVWGPFDWRKGDG